MEITNITSMSLVTGNLCRERNSVENIPLVIEYGGKGNIKTLHNL